MKIIYTDGSASRSANGAGGWAWVVEHSHECASGGAYGVDTNRMELTAVVEAVKAYPNEALIIYSDSQYVVDGFDKGRYEDLVDNGWITRRGIPLSNQDLWKPLLADVFERGNVTVRWTKGHAGHPMNEKADQMARAQYRIHRRQALV